MCRVNSVWERAHDISSAVSPLRLTLDEMGWLNTGVF